MFHDDMKTMNKMASDQKDHENEIDLGYLKEAVITMWKHLKDDKQADLIVMCIENNFTSRSYIKTMKLFTEIQVTTREIISLALAADVNNIIIGRRQCKELVPSGEDIDLLLKLACVRDVLHIKVTDYILFKIDKFYSFEATGIISEIYGPEEDDQE